jgi:hypothetical protein
MMLEFCCDPESNMRTVGKDLGLCIVRLHKEMYDLTKPEVIQQVLEFVKENPGISLWGSLPCTPWSQWQWMSIKKFGQPYLKKLSQRRRQSIALFNKFVRVAEAVRYHGGDVCFEWPKEATGWAHPAVSNFIVDFNMYEAVCHGCAFGMAHTTELRQVKPWRIVSTSQAMAYNLNQLRCCHERSFKHSHLEGKETAKSAFYPLSLCRAALTSLFPETWVVVPAMTTVPADPSMYDEDGHKNQGSSSDRVAPSM